jgi:murein DD-endopeptidase MepM/ murein hydrolase activator NlpD
VAVVVVLLLVGLLVVPASGHGYLPPVEGGVLRPFEPPEGAYGPGHRGLDLDAEPGSSVRAAAPGRVVHAGPVVRIVWVSIDHPDGIRTSYGPLEDLRVRAGDHVEAGQAIGHLAATGHGHGGRDRGLHLGARRDGVYLDPALLLGWVRPSLDGIGSHRPAAGAPSALERGDLHLPRTAPGEPRLPRAAQPGPPVAR